MSGKIPETTKGLLVRGVPATERGDEKEVNSSCKKASKVSSCGEHNRSDNVANRSTQDSLLSQSVDDGS